MTVWKIMEIARKKGLISMYRSALVSGFVNILVFFKPLDVVRHLIASRHNQPNAFSTKLLVPTSLLLPNWRTLPSNYANNIVLDFLSYGWPIDCTACTVPVQHYIIIFLLQTLILMCKPILTLNYPGMPSPDPSSIPHFPMTLFALLFKQCPKEVHQRDG